MALRLEKTVKRETASLVHEFSPESRGMSGTWSGHNAFFMEIKKKSKGSECFFPYGWSLRHWQVLCWSILGVLAQMRLDCMVL